MKFKDYSDYINEGKTSIEIETAVAEKVATTASTLN